ncbi:MAG: TrkA C-terminal domain-containing protein [Eubacteriales bacterium]|nr:TrkA C-terminal domain-containing protein [Eubacteriales bacterium]
MSEKIDTPIYAQIALDIAKRIASGEFAEGSKLAGRSLLSSTYRVSPETIRRSMHLLEDMGIARSETKSGFIILSRKEARHYVNRFKTKIEIQAVRQEIKTLFDQRDVIDEKINKLIDFLTRQADRLNSVIPLYPYEFQIENQSPLIGLTISQSKFWQNTGGTIVAIRRQGSTIFSPGPYALFELDDIFLITGDAGLEERINQFLNQIGQAQCE